MGVRIPSWDTGTDTPADGRAVSIVRSAAGGLALIDQFHALVVRLMGRGGHKPPTVATPGEGDSLYIWHGETIVEIVSPDQVNLDAWDSTRYCALTRRIKNNWDTYNNLWAEMPTQGEVDRARCKTQMSNTQDDLCFELDQMLTMCQNTLGTKLPEHELMREVCRG